MQYGDIALRRDQADYPPIFSDFLRRIYWPLR